MPSPAVEDLLRDLAPQVLGALVRRYGNFDTAEDAVQEALLAAAMQWPAQGVPEYPRGWLITVASRRLTDLLRSESARRRREDAVAAWELPDGWLLPASERPPSESDDTLILLFMCCHPSLSPASQIALTLRAVGGLTSTEIARAFLVPEATMTRRITRAKQSVEQSGIPLALPAGAEQRQRLGAVMHVLYLIFNEGYAATSGLTLQRGALAREAIRLTRAVHRLLPDDGEVAGLLALMLLTDARRDARAGEAGEPVPMADQDRSLWDRAQIAEGVELVDRALGRGAAGPYGLQAAIAAVHDRAPSAELTDWPRIVRLYELLMQISGNPVVRLNHAVAVAMASGARAGLDLIDGLRADPRLIEDRRLHAARAHLLEEAGEREAAHEAYLAAAARTTSLPQQRYLHGRAARIAGGS